MRLKHDRAVLEERKRQASASSQRRRELSMNSTTYLGSRHRSRLSGLPESQVEALTRNLEKSYYTHDEAGRPVPKTATVALYTVAAYLQSTKPPAGDPNVELHRQQIKALAMVAKALNQGPVAPVQNTTRGVVITPQSDNHTHRRRHSRDRKRDRKSVV